MLGKSEAWKWYGKSSRWSSEYRRKVAARRFALSALHELPEFLAAIMVVFGIFLFAPLMLRFCLGG